MNEVIQTGAVAVISAASTALGFLVRRHLTKASRHEQAALYSALTDLRAKMTSANVSFADLDAFEAQIRSKVREADMQLASESAEPDRYWTQSEMNLRAYAEYEVENAKLRQAIAELEGLVGENAHFREAQEAWETYRDREAEFAAGVYEGGSIQPLIRATELSVLTRERLARMEATIRDRRQIY